MHQTNANLFTCWSKPSSPGRVHLLIVSPSNMQRCNKLLSSKLWLDFYVTSDMEADRMGFKIKTSRRRIVCAAAEVAQAMKGKRYIRSQCDDAAASPNWVHGLQDISPYFPFRLIAFTDACSFPTFFSVTRRSRSDESHWLSDWVMVSRLDWWDPGEWWYLP